MSVRQDLPAGVFTVGVGGKQLQLTTSEIEHFAALSIRNPDVMSRSSRLLYVDLFVWSREFGVNPAAVVQEIRHLEGNEPVLRGTKPAAVFTRKPLAGLRYKHFFCAAFMARNIQTGLAKGRLQRIAQDAVKKLGQINPSETISEEAALAISHEVARRCVDETLEQRRSKSAITGEWIVYAEHEGQNYYLCLARHSEGDEAIRDRILEFCAAEFPFIREILRKPDPAVA